MTLYIIDVKSKRKGAKWKPVTWNYYSYTRAFTTRRRACDAAQLFVKTNRDVRVSKVKVVRNG